MKGIPDPTERIYAYLTAAPASGFAGLNVEILEQWRGDDNLLWRVRAGEEEAVVKLFLDAGQARGRRQFDGQQLFAAAGIAPEPLWFDRYPEGLPRQVLVYRWVEGQALQPDDPDALLAFVASLAAVHSGDVEAVRRISPHALNLEYFWSLLSGGLKPTQQWLEQGGHTQMAALLRELAARGEAFVSEGLPLWQATPPTLIHGDPRAENVVIRADRAVLLDWELFGLGDPALEIGEWLHRQRMRWSGALQERLLVEYTFLTGDTTVDARVQLYRKLLLLRDATFLLRGAQQISPPERMQPEYSQAVPGLVEMSMRALMESAEALEVHPVSDLAGLRAEVELLFRSHSNS